MLMEHMLGWHEATPVDGLTNCFVYLQDQTTVLGSIAYVPKVVAERVGLEPHDYWAFELCRSDHIICRYFYDPSLPIEEVQRKASCILAQLMRDNATLH